MVEKSCIFCECEVEFIKNIIFYWISYNNKNKYYFNQIINNESKNKLRIWWIQK